MKLSIDAFMSLNTIADANIYFRAILTSISKSINSDPDVPLYWECVFTEGNTEFLNIPSADWHAGWVLFCTQTEAHMNAHAPKAKEAVLMKLAELYPKSEVSRRGCIIHNCEVFHLYFCSK